MTEKEVTSFLWKKILCRFGIPSERVCDNGSQFISDRTRKFCKDFGIKLSTSTPTQANGQAESSNKAIIGALKKRLEAAKGLWAEELPAVLWANRTTPKAATGQSPFSLVYGCEAVLPVEVHYPTARTKFMTKERNDMEIYNNLDAIEELREAALIRTAAQQRIVARSFNKNVKAKVFKVGDWVLRKAFQNKKDPAAGKFHPGKVLTVSLRSSAKVWGQLRHSR